MLYTTIESSPITKVDTVGKFISTFDMETGTYVRSGIIENEADTGKDPFMAS
jgi:hypothetical protein